MSVLGDAAHIGSKIEMTMTYVQDYEETGLTEAKGRNGKQSWMERAAADWA